MNTLGQLLRKYREGKGSLLREVAADLQMDTALLSKFERDGRIPNKEQVMAFANYYEVKTDELILAWLSDKIASELQNEDLAEAALKMALKKVELFRKSKNKNP